MANQLRSRRAAILLVGLGLCLPLLVGQGCPSSLPLPVEQSAADDDASGTPASRGLVTFARPVATLIVQVGQPIPVQFDVASAEFGYELFLDNNTVAVDGVRVLPEAGKAVRSQADSSAAVTTVNTSLSTAGLEPGEYMLGVTVISGGRRVTSYASAVISLVTGPTVRILFPNGGESAPVGALVDIRFFASSPTDLNPLVQVFFDTDDDPANGRVNIGQPVRAREGGIRWDTSGRATGRYYVGAELVNASPAVRDYSDGPITLTTPGTGGGGGGAVPGPGEEGEVILLVTTPRSDTTILSSQTFAIRWSTNLLPGDGTVRLFREPDHDDDGVPDGQGQRVFIGPAGIDAAQQIYQWDTTGVRGTYFLGVICTPLVGDPVEAYSQGRLTIQATSFWLGGLGTRRDENNVVIAQSGALQGAIFRGFNFQDNLGSAMLAADDYDGDGLNEIVLGAQYAKPYIYAEDRRGAGEAYMIYGRRTRYQGDIEVNEVGQPNVPGVVMPGIMPNPHPPNDPFGRGNPLGFQVNGEDPAPFSTQGLQSITLIPDQDGDGRQELVFGFPWCDSYSLRFQAQDGFHPLAVRGIGRLERNGHFLRGGAVVVSSRNPVIANRNVLNTNSGRVLRLGDVGQIFENMTVSPSPPGYPILENRCDADRLTGTAPETATFPCDGFFQNTQKGIEWEPGAGLQIDPPRLADPIPAGGMIISPDGGCNFGTLLSLFQVDPVANLLNSQFIGGRESTDDEDYCLNFTFPGRGWIRVLGTGFYGTGTACGDFTISRPLEPYGCRILGQTTTQWATERPTTANLFGKSISVSGDFLLVGAPLRSVTDRDVWGRLPDITGRRELSGCVYMIPLRMRGDSTNAFYWSVPELPTHVDVPAPHNWIVRDVGFLRYGPDCGPYIVDDGPWDKMYHPFYIVGAAPGDRVGEVTGLRDFNGDGRDDFAVGGAGTNSGRGAVYLIYRREPQVEGHYFLERLQLPKNDPNRLNGLMIVGEVNENLGTAIAGGGPARLNDDYNNDSFADLIIGSPNAATAAGFQSGRVVIVFGGKTLLNDAGGTTLNQLIRSGDAMELIGTEAGNRTGETVANAGDINGDGVADLAFSAPMAGPPASVRRMFDSDYDGTLDAPGIDLNGDGRADDLDDDGRPDNMAECGVVYVVFGGKHLKGTISLSQIGTANLPGLVLMGRRGGDHLGGGYTLTGELARGISRAGDLDGDGRDDLLISAIEADPEGKENAGEVYVVYGFGL